MTKLQIARMNLAACVGRKLAHVARGWNTTGETFRCITGTLVHLSYSECDYKLTLADLECEEAEARDAVEAAEREERAADLSRLVAEVEARGSVDPSFATDTHGTSAAGRKAWETFRAMGVC